MKLLQFSCEHMHVHLQAWLFAHFMKYMHIFKTVLFTKVLMQGYVMAQPPCWLDRVASFLRAHLWSLASNVLHCFFLQRVRIHFTTFETEHWDHVYVYDGGTTRDTLLSSQSGSGLPGDITTNGNIALVRYTTDRTIIKPGFTIQYSAVWGKFILTFLLRLHKLL